MKTEKSTRTNGKKKSIADGESLFGSSTSLLLCRSLIVNYSRDIAKEIASIFITNFKIAIISMASISF